jgi:hypothetical protein
MSNVLVRNLSVLLLSIAYEPKPDSRLPTPNSLGFVRNSSSSRSRRVRRFPISCMRWIEYMSCRSNKRSQVSSSMESKVKSETEARSPAVVLLLKFI